MNSLSASQLPNLLRYWQHCIADEDLMGIKADEGAESLSQSALQEGQLGQDQTERLFALWQKENGRAVNNRPSAQAHTAEAHPPAALPVIVLGKAYAKRYSHGQTRDGTSSGKIFHTLYVPATLAVNGELTPTDKLPWVGRQYLAPNEDTEQEAPLIGALAVFDDWLERRLRQEQRWAATWAWCEDLYKELVQGQELEDFTPIDDARILLATHDRGTGKHVYQLYTSLLKETDLPNLFEKITQGQPGYLTINTAKRLRQIDAVRGTMSTRHGLAYSQADAVAGFTLLQDGEVMAVNGPPGTGKTTLLQSIIATETVRAAIAGKEPSVIVGVSATNQAVTNINESLNAILKDNPARHTHAWATRWIPDLESYGLYFPSKAKRAEAQAKGYQTALYTSGKWEGLPERESDPKYIEKARMLWLTQCRAHCRQPDLTLAQGVGHLRDELQTLAQKASPLRKAFEPFASMQEAWLKHSGGLAPEAFITAEDQRLSTMVQQAAAHYAQEEEKFLAAHNALSDCQAANKAAKKRCEDHHTRVETRKKHVAKIRHALRLILLPQGVLEMLVSLWPAATRFWPGLTAQVTQRQAARLEALGRKDGLISHRVRKELAARPPRDWDAHLVHVYDHDKKIWDAADQAAKKDRAECQALFQAAKADYISAKERVQHAKEQQDLAVDDRHKVLLQLEKEKEKLDAAGQAIKQAYGMLAHGIDKKDRPQADRDRLQNAHPTLADIDWVLDIGLRHELFQKAMRYWEGRWLLEAEKLQKGEVKNNAGKEATQQRYRRWCMLTPCLVSTLHSLPKHFRYAKGTGQGAAAKFSHPHMLGYIDLLIMDEAGQVAPHTGGGAFSLARRAVVVGDTYQIEPVTQITRGIDYANSAREGLRQFWSKEGEPNSPLLVSEPKDPSALMGSVMRLAQAASAVSSPKMEGERGMFLSEHRRCLPEIIRFCNQLVYQGRLVPMRQPDATPAPLPPMAWGNVRGTICKNGTSKGNEREAGAIAQWIGENGAAWCQHYGKPLDNVVAIITPFRYQATLIKKALRDRGIKEKITVGTVHSLQGAEMPFVVFSPTYNADEAGRLFFDRKPNMLNVAVSRAKDAFVVIGDMRLFRQNGIQPSNLLAQHLFTREDQELPQIDEGYWIQFSTAPRKEHIVGTARHREVLCNTLRHADANRRVIIISPWITLRALKDDDLVKLIGAAVTERRARIHIIADDELVHETPEHQAAEALAQLRQAGAQIHLVKRVHSKTLMVGAEELIEGSFNWLSASRSEIYARHEASWRICGAETKPAIEKLLEEFKNRGVVLNNY